MNTFRKNTLAIAVATLSVAGTSSVHAGFSEITTNNPFDAITSTGDKPSLVMMDLDNDGDLDAVLFHQYQDDPYPYNGYGTSVWENTGSPSEPAFTHVRDYNYAGPGGIYGTGTNITINPFAEDYNNYYGHPVSAADLDGDGDLDFFGGQDCAYSSNQLSYAEVESDGYGVVTGLTHYDSVWDGYGSNPFYGSAGQLATSAAFDGCGDVAFAAGDLSNEGDVEIVATDLNVLRFYSNDSANPTDIPQTMTELVATANPFYGFDGSALTLTSPYYGAPIQLHDVDGDGDKDLIMGTVAAADMRLFINGGSVTTPTFLEVTGTIDVSTSGWAAPTMADMDDDGDLDLIVVEVNGSDEQSIRLFENEGNSDNAALLAALLDDDDDDFLGSTGFGALLMGALGLLFRRRR